MVKQILPAITFILFLSSCTSLKSLTFTNNKKVESVNPPATHAKFLESISISTEPVVSDKTQIKSESKVNTVSRKQEAPLPKQESNQLAYILANRAAISQPVSPVQLKYAELLKTDLASLPNTQLLESVDEWYGVRYRTGGTSKSGVDCSGFSVAVYAAVYGIVLPRISRDQYRISQKISTTEIEEGDLVFFDTRGGGNVSHVGIYLGNNKFIHASVSKGVMINDLFQSYYMSRFIGAGRIVNKSIAGTVSPAP